MLLRRVLAALLVVGLVAPIIGSPTGPVSADGQATTATAASSASSVVAIDARDSHACALMSNGSLRCWGYNFAGQLGDGTDVDRWTPTPVAGLTGVVQVSVGVSHTCALRTDARVWCWGLLGVENPLTPRLVPGLTDVTAISAGHDSTCAVLRNATVACWGSNSAGKLGLGAGGWVEAPTVVPGLTGVRQVASGWFNTCAVLADRTVRCMGSGSKGVIGDGELVNRETPTAVSGLTDVKQVELGTEHACALRVEGTVWCWGNGLDFELGDGLGLPRSTPVQVFGINHAASIDTSRNHTCARLSNGGVSCWGRNNLGQLGDGTTLTRIYPVATPGLDRVRSVATQGDNTCVRRSGGTMACWGANVHGNVGDGSTAMRTSPTAVVGLGAPGHWPFASWRAMADQLFADMLGRAPGASERSQYESALGSGALTQGWAAVNLRTQADQVNVVDPTVRLYRAFLGRQPDAGGLRFWVNRRRTGSWTLVRMADHFAGSSEFRRTYGNLTNRQFVTRIYTDVLGRAADRSGVDFWTRQLDLRRRTRGSVMVGFSESNEYKRKQEENTDLAVAYFFHLGRAPSATEAHDWLTRRQAGVAVGDLLDELLSSPAYAKRIVG